MILSSFAAALGAACGSPHDAQQLGILLMAPVMIPMFLMMPVMQQPNGPIATVVSLMPPFTPVVMLMRQAMPGGIPAWQPWVALAGVVAFHGRHELGCREGFPDRNPDAGEITQTGGSGPLGHQRMTGQQRVAGNARLKTVLKPPASFESAESTPQVRSCLSTLLNR